MGHKRPRYRVSDRTDISPRYATVSGVFADRFGPRTISTFLRAVDTDQGTQVHNLSVKVPMAKYGIIFTGNSYLFVESLLKLEDLTLVLDSRILPDAFLDASRESSGDSGEGSPPSKMMLHLPQFEGHCPALPHQLNRVSDSVILHTSGSLRLGIDRFKSRDDLTETALAKLYIQARIA
ncbi:hypothetical protein C8R44DRAFT_869960 [Mycena epipterygia]|nr:hypothetical protein C8R44DRAFT_869960 [Mycena epipterygia]